MPFSIVNLKIVYILHVLLSFPIVNSLKLLEQTTKTIGKTTKTTRTTTKTTRTNY